MLADFTVKGDFVQGSSIEEVHTIGGWPQQYDGRVLSCEEPVFWSMSSVPRESFPLGLPHTVSYRITPSDEGGAVSIQCSYRLQGLLKLFVPEIVVRMAMKRTLEKILNHIGKDAVNTA